jgi:hypothetical protein
MTWEELAEKYREYWDKYFMNDQQTIVIGDDSLYLRFAKDGTVDAGYLDWGKVRTCITIATDRTPDEMELIIRGLIGEKE